jgi:TonB family protein
VELDSSSALTLLHSIQPKYPREAAKRRHQVSVTVQAYVDTSGCVLKVQVVGSTAKEFNQEVIAAVMQWRYTPAAIKNVKRIKAWATLLLLILES